MYTLFSGFRSRRVASVELPSLVASVILAEVFYKFHSFSLECLAFLATWFVLGWLLSLAASLLPATTEPAA